MYSLSTQIIGARSSSVQFYFLDSLPNLTVTEKKEPLFLFIFLSIYSKRLQPCFLSIPLSAYVLSKLFH